MVDDAISKGEKAPNINLCQITVPGTNLYCDDNLGIPGVAVKCVDIGKNTESEGSLLDDN